MDSLQTMLQMYPSSEPPQITALKKYALDIHGIQVNVHSSPRHYLIRVPNGALAHRFRIETSEIMHVCNLDKPLVIHIG